MPPLQVAIVGAGLGGLTLACALERSSIDYILYERSATVKPLGAAISLAANVVPLFKQLGLFEEMIKISKDCKESAIYAEDLTFLGAMDFSFNLRKYGGNPRIMSRPALYQLLLNKIPKEKIQFGKRVMSTSQSAEGVELFFQDGTFAKADVVVGADGAYSGIRSNMYKDLASRNLLPASDALPMQLTASCLVGTTEELDPKQFPKLLEDRAYMDVILGAADRPYMWYVFTIPGNKMAWGVTQDLNEIQNRKANEVGSGQDKFDFQEWSSETAQGMMDDCKHFPTTMEVDLGELMKKTMKENISKIMLEQKMFETWYDGRTVLLGDAAHKMTPAAGQGAVQSMLDAASLASCLNEVEVNTVEALRAAFATYRSERYDIALEAVNVSVQFNSLFCGKSYKDMIVRNIFLNWMPAWVQQAVGVKLSRAKNQITYLPFVEDLGQVKHIPMQEQSSKMAVNVSQPVVSI